MCQRVGGAIVKIRGIGIVLRTAFGTVIGHFRSAVSTEQKSRQRIGFAKRIVASRCLSQFLCKLPHFLIYNRFMGVLKDQPVLLRIHNWIFVLVGLLVRTEVDRMPHIFGLGENLPNDITTPVIRVGKFLFAFPNATPLLCGVDRRSFHLIVIEDTGDVIRTVSLDGQPENTADNRSGFLVNIPTVLITRHFLVAINGTVGGRLAGFAFHTDRCFLLATQITKIPLVHNVEERGKLIAVLIVAVHAVGNRHKVNMMLTEEYLRVKACLQIVTPRPAHIFYNDMSNFACFNVCNKLFPSGTLKISSTPTVIGIVLTVRITFLMGIAFEVFFLIDNTVAITSLVIITGQPFI